jgi:6-pyruvoyltetrahydropterin/6-carboxytetrahydropterin synthase
VISVTRVYRFSASHRLHSLLLTDGENAAMFGKCNNPYGHGHDYVLSITVAGPVNEVTGLVIPPRELDALVEAQVLRAFSHVNINVDVPQFSNLVPTAENIALVIADLLREHWSEYVGTETARLRRVHVQETERNGVEVLVPARSENQRIATEGLLVHA